MRAKRPACSPEGTCVCLSRQTAPDNLEAYGTGRVGSHEWPQRTEIADEIQLDFGRYGVVIFGGFVRSIGYVPSTTRGREMLVHPVLNTPGIAPRFPRINGLRE